MKITLCKTSNWGGSTLVDFRPKLEGLHKGGSKLVFITISPNPTVTHNMLRSRETLTPSGRTRSPKVYKIQYSQMTHDEQYQYLEHYIREVYVHQLELDDFIYWVYELNSNNDLHIHAILYSPDVQDIMGLKGLRKLVYSQFMTQKNLPKKGVKKDYMNNIVYVDDALTTIDYLLKDNTLQTTYSPAYWGSL